MSRSSSLPAVAGVLVTGALGGCLSFFFPYAPDNAAETFLRAQCAFAYRCCEPSERDAASSGFSGFRNEDECVAAVLENPNPLKLLGTRAKAVVDDGKGEFDAELADECLKPIIDAAYACDAETLLAPPAQSPECSAALNRLFVVGNVEDGDECTDDLQCADEGNCVVEEEANTITGTGECVARAGKGDTCRDGDTFETVKDCQSGLFCGPDNTCVAIELLDDGADCFSNEECKSGRCSEVAEAIGSCSDSDAECATDDDCRTCVFDTDTPCTSDNDCDVGGGDFCNFGDSCERSTRNVCSDDAPNVEICNGT
jgi:hypothetical protein